MIGGYADFLRWVEIFNLKSSDAPGTVSASYGEMYFYENTRPTYGTYPSATFYKVEAGPSITPTTPPDYSLYEAGELNNWEFDITNARLTYVGAMAGYYEVSASLSASIYGFSGDTVLRFALRKNDDTNNAITQKSTMPILSASDTDIASCVCKGFEFFENGDYVDIVALNNTNTAIPLVSFLNFTVKSIGNNPTPLAPTLITTNAGDFITTNNGNFLITN